MKMSGWKEGVCEEHKSHKYHNAAPPSAAFPRGRVWAGLDPGLSHSYVNHTCPARPSARPRQPPSDSSRSSPARLLMQHRNSCSRRARGSKVSLRGSAPTPAAKPLETSNLSTYAEAPELYV